MNILKTIIKIVFLPYFFFANEVLDLKIWTNKEFPTYPEDSYPLWWWHKRLTGKDLKKSIPGHSPSDAMTKREATQIIKETK